jgi:hypothetical protein
MSLTISYKRKMQFSAASKPRTVQNIGRYCLTLQMQANSHSAWRTNILTVGKLWIQICLLSCFNCSIQSLVKPFSEIPVLYFSIHHQSRICNTFPTLVASLGKMNITYNRYQYPHSDQDSQLDSSTQDNYNASENTVKLPLKVVL